MYPISKTARKETPRDRLRKDNNAEPRRMSNAECTSVIGKKLKKNTGQVTACVEPKLNREELEREVAADFGDWILQPLDQNPVMQFRDTIFAPFRLAHEAEDYHSLELLRDVVKGHNSGSDDMLNARMEWTAPGRFDSWFQFCKDLAEIVRFFSCGRSEFRERWLRNRIKACS
jgi:hypothetical protein